MKPLLAGLLGWLLVINVVTAIAYAWDKTQARRHGRRIPERTLFLLNLAGGVGGAWLVFFGMRHKTLHRSFWFVQSMATILWILLFVILPIE
jgi:uncharacterized membrane protein YsdA (DUF1294 family)